MIVLLDLEWVENNENHLTQLSAVRTDENWNEIGRLDEIVRTPACCLKDQDHVAFGGFSTKLFENGIPEGTNIYIGKENSNVLLRRSAVVATRYTIENQPAGLIAVIGSTRFDYPKAVSILECISKHAGSFIEELLSVRQ